jgi:hypothetical protein
VPGIFRDSETIISTDDFNLDWGGQISFTIAKSMTFRNTAVFLFSLLCNGQVMQVPLESLGERIVVVVPMVGTGTIDDPIRPKYAPVSMSFQLMEKQRKEGKIAPTKELSDEDKVALERKRIGAYSYLIADDGKRAIVEFVARDREAFAEILKDPQVRAISKLRIKDEAELEELRKVKRDFDPKDLRTAGY